MTRGGGFSWRDSLFTRQFSSYQSGGVVCYYDRDQSRAEKAMRSGYWK